MSDSGRTHAERALTTLRQRILCGDLPGGTRLLEVGMAEELNISRTPIRAALSKLAEEGLLDRAKGSGFVVRSFEIADVTDTIELRGVLEGTAARFAAERGVSPELLAESLNCVTNIDRALRNQSIDIALYSVWNSKFHELLLRMSASNALEREILRITSLPFASPSAFLDDEAQADQLQTNLSAANEQHKAIIDAISNREGTRAESLAREHARTALRNVKFLTSEEAALREGAPTLALLRH